MTGAVPIQIGIPLLQIPTGDFMQVLRQTTMTTHGDGDLLGDGMVVIAHIGAGAGTVAGAGVQAFPGAGEALSDGEVHTGAILLIGEDIMIHSGADTTETHIGDTEEATGVVAITTDLFTEEAVSVEEDSRIQG